MATTRKFILRNDAIRDRAAEFIKSFKPDDGKLYENITQEVKSKRTTDQNTYLHKLFADIADFTGDTPKSVKSDMKMELLEPLYEKRKGNIIMREYPHTADMSVRELTEFAERVEAFAITKLEFVRGR